MKRSLFKFSLVLVFAPLVCAAQEQETPEPPAAQQAEPNASSTSDEAKKLADLIKGLDSEEYTERQAASKQLGEEGVKALPALEKGAQSESREVAMRCFDLIRKLFESKDGDAKSQAAATLEKLAKSSDAPLASRSQKLLESVKAHPPVAPADPVVPGIRAIPIAPGAIAPIRMRIEAIAGGAGKHIRVTEKDGVKDIEAKEEGRKVKIHDDPENGIDIEVTETKDGKEETKKYSAKNAEALKKDEPEAYKIYEEFSKRGPRIEAVGGIGGFGGILPGVPVPAGAPFPVPVPAIPAGVPAAAPVDPEAFRKIRGEVLEKQLESVQKMIESLEKQKARLLEQKAELEKETPKPIEKPAETPNDK